MPLVIAVSQHKMFRFNLSNTRSCCNIREIPPSEMAQLYAALERTIRSLTSSFDSIPGQRIAILKELATYIEEKRNIDENADLIFICTHNSRRSHISQLWAQTAAAYYGIAKVTSCSGGTEATAFNPRAVRAMEKAGFQISKESDTDNPIYVVSFSEKIPPIRAFSKTYDSKSNPQRKFAAIMTCSHADENCPMVNGSEKRIALPYDDPKNYDGTNYEEEKYTERVNEIGREILYAFSLLSVDAALSSASS